MKTMLITSFVALTLVSCGRKHDTTHTETITKEVIEVPTPEKEVTPEQQDLEDILADENDYRIGQGQTMLSKGLSCALYTHTGGDRIQASIANHNTLQGLTHVASYTFNGVFNQLESSVNDGLNVLPAQFMSTYKTMYLLRCTGFIIVEKNDYVKFDLASDDASILYIAGAKIIDNDNNHAISNMSATKFLRRGVHAFRLDYAQQGGSQALVLKMNEELLKSERYAH